MDKEKFNELRRRARGLLDQRQQLNPYVFSMSMSALITELDTYRVELELQNEELRNAQDDLEDSRLKYLTLYNLSPTGYLILDRDGRIVEANKRVAHMLKADGSQLLNQKFSAFIHFDDQDIFHLLTQRLRDSLGRQNCCLRLVSEDASPLHGQVEAVIGEENKEVAGKMLIALTDITELIRARQEIITLNEELELRVERRTLQLQQAQNQLLHSEKLAAIGTLSASIAHELNNPLQGVLSVVSGIRQRAQLSDEDAELVGLAVKECKRMRDLIKTLQDFNQPTSGISAPFDLHKALDSVLLLNKKLLSTRKITIEKQYSDDIPILYGVADQIKQVAMNLLSNSIDASHEGGVVSIATGVEDAAAILTVRDNGAGIDPRHKSRIFEPFFSTKPDAKGSGLGLFVCQGIVKNHKGSIEVESTPGEETLFRIRLPIRETGRR